MVVIHRRFTVFISFFAGAVAIIFALLFILLFPLNLLQTLASHNASDRSLIKASNARTATRLK